MSAGVWGRQREIVWKRATREEEKKLKLGHWPCFCLCTGHLSYARTRAHAHTHMHTYTQTHKRTLLKAVETGLASSDDWSVFKVFQIWSTFIIHSLSFPIIIPMIIYIPVSYILLCRDWGTVEVHNHIHDWILSVRWLIRRSVFSMPVSLHNQP